MEGVVVVEQEVVGITTDRNLINNIHGNLGTKLAHTRCIARGLGPTEGVVVVEPVAGDVEPILDNIADYGRFLVLQFYNVQTMLFYCFLI